MGEVQKQEIFYWHLIWTIIFIHLIHKNQNENISLIAFQFGCILKQQKMTQSPLFKGIFRDGMRDLPSKKINYKTRHQTPEFQSQQWRRIPLHGRRGKQELFHPDKTRLCLQKSVGTALKSTKLKSSVIL